jgi:putative transposase
VKIVPKAQPEISQTRSVWYRGKRKPVLKGRWKHLNDDCTLEIPSSFQDESICMSKPDTACLANFRRRSATSNATRVRWKFKSHSATKLCRITLYAIHAFKPAFPHRVLSTKDRHPFIADDWRGCLHEYLGGLVRAADGIPEAVGGTADHVHLLVGLRATHALATFVQDIKQTSSRWVHETSGVKNFAWQPGYGAFTVSVSNCDVVKEYIANQVEHHRTKTFQEEYVAFLQKHGVEYDEKYLW